MRNMMETYFTELCSRPCTAAFSSFCKHSQGITKTDLLSLLLRLHFFVLAAHSNRHFMGTRDTGRWLSLTLLSSNSSSLSDYLLWLLHLCSQFLGSYADLVAHPVFLPLMAPHSSPFSKPFTIPYCQFQMEHVLPGISGGYTRTDVKQGTHSSHTPF